MSKSSGVIHTTSVSRPQLKCYQVKDKVVPNNSQLKFQKKEVEDHNRISSISKKTKSVTACNDSSKSRTSNENAVCAECGTCVFNSNHDACVSRYLKDMTFEHSSSTSVINVKRRLNTTVQASFLNVKMTFDQRSSSLVLYQMTSDHNRSELGIQDHSNEPSSSKLVPKVVPEIFRKSTCFVRDLQGNTQYLFKKQLHQLQSVSWLKLHQLKHGYGIEGLMYFCKAKRSSFKAKAVPSSKGRLNLLYMDLCGPMQVASINGKKHILVIVDDYSRYTWTLFLRSKDETPEVLKDFLMMIQCNLQARVITVRTDRGTEFLNKTLHAYFKEKGIEHQTSTPRTPKQNGVVERQNRTLVEAARTMLSASKLPLSFWAEAIATACYTQNKSIIISTHGKMAYHLINNRKPLIKHLHIFGCICYIIRDGENLDKMKEKGDPCVMVGYSTQSKGYYVYNKRTRLIVESINIKFDEIKEMMFDHNSSDLVPQRQEMSVENVSSCLVPQGQKVSDMTTLTPCPQDKMLFLQQKRQIRHNNG
ncbi:retrovirus-related pol polyprotein from transposon TNT 1-94 [Tanacetum coccineum]